jgi:hypothetical protein
MLPKQPLRLIFAFVDVSDNNEAVLSRREGIRANELLWLSRPAVSHFEP